MSSELPHTAKTKHAQSHCVWCSKRIYSWDHCLNDDQKTALCDYVRANGGRWRVNFNRDREKGFNSDLLAQVASIISPSNLMKIKSQVLGNYRAKREREQEQ